MIPILTGGLSTVLSGLSSTESVMDVQIATVVVCAASTLASTFHQYLGFLEKVKQHGAASRSFGDIASDIEFFLNQTKITQADLAAFSEGIHERVDIFEGQEPLIQQGFMEKAKQDEEIAMSTQRLVNTKSRITDHDIAV